MTIREAERIVIHRGSKRTRRAVRPCLDHDPREQDTVLEQAFACAADAPQSGLRVAELRSHNEVEAWRETQGVESV